MEKFIPIFLAIVMMFSMFACTSKTTAETSSDKPTESSTAAQTVETVDKDAAAAADTEGETKKLDLQPGDIIGVSLTSRGSERWVRDSESLEAAITAAGYTPLIQYNENNTSTQVSQIQNMVLAGAKVIIVCPYDNGSLSAVLKEAREQGVIIINYDLAVIGTGDADYFVGYNNREVGVMQANAIIEGLGLDEGAEGPFYIEMFAGSLNEANCYYYFDYAMEVLQPYFESGQLICKSGETTIEKCTIIDWDLAKLTAKLDARMTAYYSDCTHLDAVLVPSDYFSGPVAILLQGYGYGTEECPMPVITGNDCYESVCKLIANDLVYMTVLKDTTLLSDACMYIIDCLASGEPVEGTVKYQPTEDYDFELDAYFVDMFSVTKANLQELVIDSGFYSADQIYSDLTQDDYGLN